MIETVKQDLESLPLKARPALSVLAQLSRAGVQLINSEAEQTILVRSFRHGLRLPRNYPPTSSVNTLNNAVIFARSMAPKLLLTCLEVRVWVTIARKIPASEDAGHSNHRH